MPTFRTTYWYLSSYTKKHLKTIVSAIIGGVILFAILLPLSTNLPQVKPTSYVGIIGAFDLSSLPREIETQISAGLTKIEEDGSASPDLAQRWSIEDDGKTYRFILKQGIIWQDGKPVTPQDIVFNFQDTQIITTESEIIFKLKEPFAPFPIVVAQPLFQEVETSYLRFWKRKKIIGVGTYNITRITYQDNRLSELILDSPNDRIVYRFYITEDRAKNAFAHGKIDVIQEISDATEFENWPNVEMSSTVNTDQYLGIFFNHDHPYFEKNIRQALSYSLTKSDPQLRAKGPINPNSWAYLDGVKSYAYDLERGIERILDGPPQQPLNIELTTIPRFQGEAEIIKTEWEEFGVKSAEACQSAATITDKALCENMKIAVDIKVSNFPDVNDYQALLVGQEIPADPDQYSFWHSTQNTNLTHYKNPRIDALLENGRKTSDQNERKALYQEFQQFLLEDAPAVFIRSLESYTIRRK